MRRLAPSAKQDVCTPVRRPCLGPVKPGTAARAAARHDGTVLQGELGVGEGEDAYMTELAAQLDVAAHKTCSRLLIAFHHQKLGCEKLWI